MDEKEIWENTAAGDRYVRTFQRGEERMSRVPPGGRVSVSPEERESNSLRVAAGNDDFFANGDLVPVKLVESASDYVEVASNPNLLADGELSGLLDLKVPEFKEKVNEITNLQVLDRLDHFAGLDNVAKGKLEALSTRREELTPKRKPMSGSFDDSPEKVGESVE